MKPAPYLSIVAATRNDDHGKDLLKRTQIFVSGLLSQIKRHRLPTEIILVEWNPPNDRPRLKDVLSWNDLSNDCSIRVIEVPNSIHNRFEYAHNLPLYQMIAKNVGIRRAQGQFVLATNIDLLFSNELFEFFAQRKLQTGKLYRVNRYDVDPSIRIEDDLDEQLEFCRRNLVRLNLSRCHTSMKSGECNKLAPDDVFLHPETQPWIHVNGNASGDFQLMAMKDWLALKGYAEFDMYSLHIDNLLEFAAVYSGFEECTLKEPFRVYHIEHGGGWTPESQKDGNFSECMKKRSLRVLSDEEFRALLFAMPSASKPITYNKDNWGLAKENLWETVLSNKT